jgi:hypothetical protein
VEGDCGNRLGVLLGRLLVIPEWLSYLQTPIGRESLPHACGPEIAEILFHDRRS